MPSPLIGIDLGTTHSLCAVFVDGAPKLIPNAHGSVLTPSVVGVTAEGEILVGEAAREWRITCPEATASQFKRWMGEDRKISLGDKTFSPPELSSLVLRSLVGDAEAFLGVPITEAVITVPAYFNEHQRRATRAAGELAGLKVRRVLNEPTAAALSYGFHRGKETENLLIFDLGGGTFDVTVMEIFEGSLEIRSTAGESHLGGEDFTDRLVQWALSTKGLYLEHVEMSAPLQVARLREEAENAKRALSDQEHTQLRLPDSKGQITPGSAPLAISRALFQETSEPLTQRLKRPTERALRDAELSWRDIDAVLLVGGATRMELVRDLIRKWSEKEPRNDVDPDQVVALGAAVQAALIENDEAVEDLIMTDVCPFTLGIGISKEFGRQVVHGYYLPVIHRNTTIPVSREETVYTLRAQQTEIQLEVYQGEARKIEGNLKLGELTVSDIPPGPAGQEVRVRFTYDLNGLLDVEALATGSEKRSRILLKQNVQGLSEKEIKAAHKKMQALKFYPRDDLENRRLLHFGETVIAELNQHQRGALEEALDQFESALDSGDKDRFKDSREALLISLSSLGFSPPPGDSDPQS
ncbi:MAG: molecular chaperone HscC [Planctomycetes bacterium]|nr:molecular chaperone HscC [Planctomycetota bacterium]